jgi:hypothetical protein
MICRETGSVHDRNVGRLSSCSNSWHSWAINGHGNLYLLTMDSSVSYVFYAKFSLYSTKDAS